MTYQGNPCWYELYTADPDAAGRFYGPLLGWDMVDSGMTGIPYRLAKTAAGMVAGMTARDTDPARADPARADPPRTDPHWMIYFAVDDCDRSCADLLRAGGRIVAAPRDIPGTGRFAIVCDPQQAVFGLLQPDMTGMSAADIAKAEAGEGAFSPENAGHVWWNELASAAPEAACAFYQRLLGWHKSRAMDMGEMGLYQMLSHKGRDLGAIMGLGQFGASAWLPYFGVDRPVSTLAAQITALGGRVHHGPTEVPGPMWIAIAQDPEGAWFAIVGAEK